MRAMAIAGALLMLPAGASADQQAPGADKLKAVQARIEADCAADKFSGVLVVVQSGRELIRHACGKVGPSGRPITFDTRFKLFSTSKLLTALAVMSMVERGEMKLDAPVAAYVPDVPRAWRAATIGQLLQHTSGIPDLTDPQLVDAFRTSHPAAMRRVLAAAAKDRTELVSKPGETWRYNNFGYELLADAAAKAAGVPFAEILKRRVFEPAGMRDALVETAVLVGGKRVSARDARLAAGFNGAPGALEPATSMSFIQLGAGAVHATAGDMLALDRAIADNKIVSAATWRLMTDPATLKSPNGAPGAGYGLGVAVRNLPELHRECHDGGTNGYVADFCRFPRDDAAVVLLSNRGYVRIGDWRKALTELITAR